LEIVMSKDTGINVKVPYKIVLYFAQQDIFEFHNFDDDVLAVAGLNTPRKIRAFARELAKDPQYRKNLSSRLSKRIEETGVIGGLPNKVKLYKNKLNQLEEIQAKRNEDNAVRLQLLDAIEILNSKGYDVVLK